MAQIIEMPRTPEGRDLLRESLFILKKCGPAPDGSTPSNVDWDRLAKETENFFDYMESRR